MVWLLEFVSVTVSNRSPGNTALRQLPSGLNPQTRALIDMVPKLGKNVPWVSTMNSALSPVYGVFFELAGHEIDVDTPVVVFSRKKQPRSPDMLKSSLLSHAFIQVWTLSPGLIDTLVMNFSAFFQYS